MRGVLWGRCTGVFWQRLHGGSDRGTERDEGRAEERSRYKTVQRGPEPSMIAHVAKLGPGLGAPRHTEETRPRTDVSKKARAPKDPSPRLLQEYP